jgi:hypothetical protein
MKGVGGAAGKVEQQRQPCHVGKQMCQILAMGDRLRLAESPPGGNVDQRHADDDPDHRRYFQLEAQQLDADDDGDQEAGPGDAPDEGQPYQVAVGGG